VFGEGGVVTEETYDWRDKLEPGDTVIVTGRYAPTITQVERLTKTQIVCKNGMRFSRLSGDEIGGYGPMVYCND
jgi:murein L,D-transpeptidase YafK